MQCAPKERCARSLSAAATTCHYGLLGTARLNGRDREAYLRHVLSRIAENPIN
jgi:hypothetical protein